MDASAQPMRPIRLADALGDQAYVEIRQAIVSGLLAPGSKVTERSLAEFLGVSPTPVREALRRLQHERLVVRLGRERRVVHLGEVATSDLIVIYASLRGVAARLAATKATDAELEEMRLTLEAANTAGSSPRAARRAHLYGEFHAQVEAAANNQMLDTFISTASAFDLAARHQSIESRVAGDLPGLERRQAQHREIYEAIAARDGARADALMRDHTEAASRSYMSGAGPRATWPNISSRSRRSAPTT
jgi:DNA-binding GntR family transcriptional regulator